jgi:carboxyl-terminal processing protease
LFSTFSRFSFVSGGKVKKGLVYSIVALFAVILLAGAFSGGFLVGHYLHFGGLTASYEGAPSLLEDSTITPSNVQGDSASATPQDLETLFKPFWETWAIVHSQYVDQPVDDVALMRGAIRGMLESLGDEHTSYMDPQEYTDANAGLEGSYEGIGAYVDTGGDYLTVTSPIPGSPAEKAGLKPGDEIIAIDGEDMTGINPELARRKVLGPAGTVVLLTIRREGTEEPFDVEITRDKINIASVESEMLDNDIAYVKLNTFGDTTTRDLKEQLGDLMDQNPKGLILDLRYNGGGYLQTAVEVTSQFISDGVVLYEQYGDGRKDSYDAIRGGLALDVPMVVLINKGSASASEIVAGALQDYDRAQLVGETSYGKGSVQNWIPLEDNQGAVRVTIAKWLTPEGRTIHKLGLTPDVVVELTDEDAAAELDPQLDKAIELLSK